MPSNKEKIQLFAAQMECGPAPVRALGYDAKWDRLFNSDNTAFALDWREFNSPAIAL
jgi:hypothetical protein